MSYLALYRRYRPVKFEDVIGQDHVVKTLINQIENDRLGHAYLFTGTRGTGKTTTAKIFAKAINCLHPVNGSPCGECEACKALSSPSNIDIIEIDAASNNGVNEIRELRDNVQFAPASCRYKVYIIDEVHMLTGAAFNALLKTLEEPPKHAVFILATTEAHKIPATILSRCMRFDFKLVPTEKIAKLIADIYDEQGKKYEKEAVGLIARAGEGSIRDALSIADIAVSYGDGTLTYKDVTEILGSANYETTAELVESVIDGDTGKIFGLTEELAAMGKSMGVLIKDITSFVRDVLVAKTCKDANSILGLPESRFKTIADIAEKSEENRLLRILEIFAEAEGDLKYSTHPRIVFETAAVKAASPASDGDISALLGRVSAIEKAIAEGKVSVKPDKKAEDKVEKEPPKAKEKTFGEDEIKGKLLFNLGSNGSEMLRSTLQDVKITLSDDEITIVSEDKGVYDIAVIPENFERIENALKEFGKKVKIAEPKREKILSEIDAATERMKKIFGEEIVIVKN